MSMCRYILSKECHNKDCVKCILEQIKSEIIEYRININAGSGEFHMGRVFGCDDIINIIDKHISELKGENK